MNTPLWVYFLLALHLLPFSALHPFKYIATDYYIVSFGSFTCFGHLLDVIFEDIAHFPNYNITYHLFEELWLSYCISGLVFLACWQYMSIFRLYIFKMFMFSSIRVKTVDFSVVLHKIMWCIARGDCLRAHSTVQNGAGMPHKFF